MKNLVLVVQNRTFVVSNYYKQNINVGCICMSVRKMYVQWMYAYGLILKDVTRIYIM